MKRCMRGQVTPGSLTARLLAQATLCGDTRANLTARADPDNQTAYSSWQTALYRLLDAYLLVRLDIDTPRRLYALTPAGEQELERLWVEQEAADEEAARIAQQEAA